MLSNIFRKRTDNSFLQLIRYSFSGGAAFLVDAALLYFFTEIAGLHYLVSTVIGFSFGLAITYFFSVLWVFDNRKYIYAKEKEFGLFAIIAIIGLALTFTFEWFFTNKVGLHYLISKIFTTFIVFLWNFFMKKLTLFPKNNNKN